MLKRFMIAFRNLIRRVNLKKESRRLFCNRIGQACAVDLLRNGTVIANNFACCMRQDTFTFNCLTCVFSNLFLGRRTRTFLTFINGSFLNERDHIASKRLTRIGWATTFLCRFKRAICVSNETIIISKGRQVNLFLAGYTCRIMNTFLRFNINTLRNVRLSTATMTSNVCKECKTTTRASTVVISASSGRFITNFQYAFRAIALNAMTCASNGRGRFIVTVGFFFFFVFRDRRKATS